MSSFNNENNLDRANSAAENASKEEEKMSNSSKKTPWHLRFAPGAILRPIGRLVSKAVSRQAQSCNPFANDSINGTGARKPRSSPLWQSPLPAFSTKTERMSPPSLGRSSQRPPAASAPTFSSTSLPVTPALARSIVESRKPLTRTPTDFFTPTASITNEIITMTIRARKQRTTVWMPTLMRCTQSLRDQRHRHQI